MTEVSRERFEQCRQSLQPFSDDAPQELADAFDYAEQEHAAREAAEKEGKRLAGKNVDLALRALDIEATIDGIRNLHGKWTEGGTEYCEADGYVWPCATIRVLDSQLPAGQETGRE